MWKVLLAEADSIVLLIPVVDQLRIRPLTIMGALGAVNILAHLFLPSCNKSSSSLSVNEPFSLWLAIPTPTA
jgi:hypothetical protein